VMLQARARQALGYLAHSWLPFLVPDAHLDVLILRRTAADTEDGPALKVKVRALLLA